MESNSMSLQLLFCRYLDFGHRWVVLCYRGRHCDLLTERTVVLVAEYLSVSNLLCDVHDGELCRVTFLRQGEALECWKE